MRKRICVCARERRRDGHGPFGANSTTAAAAVVADTAAAALPRRRDDDYGGGWRDRLHGAPGTDARPIRTRPQLVESSPPRANLRRSQRLICVAAGYVTGRVPRALILYSHYDYTLPEIPTLDYRGGCAHSLAPPTPPTGHRYSSWSSRRARTPFYYLSLLLLVFYLYFFFIFTYDDTITASSTSSTSSSSFYSSSYSFSSYSSSFRAPTPLRMSRSPCVTYCHSCARL